MEDRTPGGGTYFGCIPGETMGFNSTVHLHNQEMNNRRYQLGYKYYVEVHGVWMPIDNMAERFTPAVIIEPGTEVSVDWKKSDFPFPNNRATARVMVNLYEEDVNGANREIKGVASWRFSIEPEPPTGGPSLPGL